MYFYEQNPVSSSQKPFKMNLIDDKDLVKRCLAEIKQQMGYTASARLSQRDIEHLSEQIEAKTKILISLSTLKRILNGQFDRLPQTSTLNALTCFAGYTGWHDFKAKKISEQTIENQPENKKPESKNKNHTRFWIGAGIFLLLVLMTLLLQPSLLRGNNTTSEVKFSARQTSTARIPNSVVFTYDVSKTDADSFYFQQSWNEKTRISIQKNNHTLTDIYYEPGYHRAKLWANGKVLKEVGVNITTKEWVSYTKRAFTEIKPRYFSKGKIIHDGVLGLTDEAFDENHIDFQQDQLYFSTFFPEILEAEGDNFMYKVRFRLRKIKATLCPWIMTEVFCQNSFIYFTNTISGCISEINAKISDNYLSGKTTDLSAFGCDLTQWQELEIRVINKNVGVYLAHKKIFEKPYQQALGPIAGIGFASNGLFEIDEVVLKNHQNKVIYQASF